MLTNFLGADVQWNEGDYGEHHGRENHEGALERVLRGIQHPAQGGGGGAVADRSHQLPPRHGHQLP